MGMDRDLNYIIDGWDYDPEDFLNNVRKIQGQDAKEKIQLRTDLGLYQMEIKGRPDGKKPGGKESMLDHLLFKAQEHEGQSGAMEGRFHLTEADIAKLYREAIQYYHRRICFFALKEFDKAKKDAEHTLKIMDVVKMHASNKMAVMHFEQYRPYLIGEKARACGLDHLEKKDYAAALRAITEGINEILSFYQSYGHDELVEKCQQIRFLREWYNQVRKEWENDTGDNPLSNGLTLEEQLQIAIQTENYEEAARVRDLIKERQIQIRNESL